MFEQGRPLTVQERALFKPYFANIVIDKARVIDGKVPFWLSKRMCAVVLYNHIYFRSGAYQPNTKRGAELLGHELTHVSQFLYGMSLFKYIWSCRKGYMESPYELEAYEKGKFIAKYFDEFVS